MSTQPTALAQLRHLYQNMLNGGVRDPESAKRIAEGLLGPAIEALERGTPATEGEPVGWEWRWKDTSPHTVTSGQWSEWKRVEARSRLSTVEDAVREFQHYIADGAAYELRQLYTSPQPVREPLSTIDLMRVVMKADEESQDTRGTTNWAAHIGKAVQNAVLGITGGQHGTDT